MKVLILQLDNPEKVLNKDYAGGFGAGFPDGKRILTRFFHWMRKSAETLPLMAYGYATAIFREAEHEVILKTNEIIPADLVLIQPSMADYSHELAYIKRIRNETDAKIGVMGPFAKAMPHLFEPYVDFITLGDPESVLIDIANGGQIPSGQIVTQKVGLDSLPYPAWDMFDWKNFGNTILLDAKPAFFIQASRGCFYRCNYCPYLVIGSQHKIRKPEKVVDEIEHLISKYGAKGLLFRDPLFTGAKHNAIALAEEIIKRGIKIQWVCETRLDHLTTDMLDLFHKAGLRTLKVGIESANEEILKLDNRIPIPIKHQEEMIKHCEKLHIKTCAFYIVGHPDDTHETIAQTINHAQRLNTPIANFTVATPFPGTAFYEQVKDQIFETDLNKWDSFHSVFRHKNLSKEEIENYNELMFKKYYLRPKYIAAYAGRMFQN